MTYKEIAESAMKVLEAIADAKKFKDNMGDKMIVAVYSDLARCEIALIKSRMKEVREKELNDLRDKAGLNDRDSDLEFENHTRYQEND